MSGAPDSLAGQRGQNWSLPEEAKNVKATVTRPVIIECRADRIILLPETYGALPQEIPFTGRTQDSVDNLVTAVWAHSKTWGYAGRGLTWHPTLSVQVAPGGEQRFAELQQLMAGSGLEVSQRTQVAAAPPPPKPAKKNIFNFWRK